MKNGGLCYGQNLNAAAAAAANILAEKFSADEIAILGAFFTVVGDALSAIATTQSICEGTKKPPDA